MGVVLPPMPAALAGVITLLGSTLTRGQLDPVEPADVCRDFAAGSYPNLPWTSDDCLEVWTHFKGTIGYKPRHPEADIWRDTAMELRQQGAPCLLASATEPDGLGSTTIRHLSTWIFAAEIGCDWITPDWGYRKVSGSGEAAARYCHSIMPSDDRRSLTNASHLTGTKRCSTVNWLSYFQFDRPSVSWPTPGSVKIVRQPGRGSIVDGMVSVQEELQLERSGSVKRGWEHLVFLVGVATGSHHILNAGSWNHSKRDIVRRILEQMRENFHRHPREWYDEDLHCLYDRSRLHFAVHVRLGDRHLFTDKHPEYIQRLEDVMFTISQEVAGKGLSEPLFHIFSETMKPCPSEKTGSFDEFPSWPVVIDQVTACPKAVGHDGIFQVRERAIMLHFDRDVRSALSCMIQADGILMGCSTFGQIAGIFSKGISMFSTQCGGDRTPPQYRMIPPLAVSERGHMWVPIVGSWFDPVLKATRIFRNSVDTLLDAT